MNHPLRLLALLVTVIVGSYVLGLLSSICITIAPEYGGMLFSFVLVAVLFGFLKLVGVDRKGPSAPKQGS